MGRKSNTKKALRKKIEQQEALSDKPIKRSTKKKLRKEVKKQLDGSEPKAEKSAKKQKKIDPLKKQKIIGGLTVLLTGIILLVFGYLLFQKAFRAMPIAKLLPAEQTVAFIDLNTDQQHNQYLRGLQLIENHKDFLDEQFVQKLENFWGIDFETDLRPWLGRQMGLALLNSMQDDNAAHIIYFAEIKFQDELQKRLQEDAEAYQYKGYTIYSTQPAAYMAIMKDYLIVSIEEIGIKELIDSSVGSEKKLFYTAKYRRIDDNSPLNTVANLYMDFDKINEGTLSYLPFLTERGFSTAMLTPLQALFDAEGISLVALEDQFALQGFVSLDRENFKGTRFVGFNPKYDAGLANYTAPDALSFWGGENFEFQINRIINVLSAGDKAKSSLLGSLIENYAQRYFGSEITLEDDIAPLFSKEFAIALEESEAGRANYKILLELADPEIDSKRLAKIINAFAQVSAIFEPTVVQHILPDGTYTEEVVASPQAITTNDNKYREITIHSLKTTQNNWGIHYAIFDDIAVIADSLASVEKTIDIHVDQAPSLRDSEVFAAKLKTILKSSDEISYFNMEALVPILLGDDVPELMQPISSYSSGRNYFYDGITGVGYLQLK